MISNDIIDFLHACLDEDERIARAADGDEIEATPSLRGAKYLTLRGQHDDRHTTELPAALADHIAAHDPARVLREIDAKRQLIGRGGPFCTSDCDKPGNEPMDPDTNWTTPLEHHFDCAAYKAAKVLALPYADRPGYREEWKP